MTKNDDVQQTKKNKKCVCVCVCVCVFFFTVNKIEMLFQLYCYW